MSEIQKDESTQMQQEHESLVDQAPEDQLANAAQILSKVQSAGSAEPVDQEPEFEVAPEPAPSQRKARKPRPPKAATPAVPASIKKMMGAGEKFRFYKVDKLGKTGLIGDYTSHDLANADNDVERFIQAYLVPKYNDGEYRVVAYNEKGTAVRDQNYSVLSPLGANAPVPGVPVGNLFEQNLVNNQRAEYEKLQAQIRESEAAQRDQLLSKNKSLEDSVAELKTSGQSSSADMMMMMFKMNTDNKRELDAERRRSELKLEAMRLEAQMKISMQPAPVALPPPPAPVDPFAQMTQMMMFMEKLRPERDTTEVTMLREQLRDLKAKDEKPSGLSEVFEQMNALDQMVQNRYGDKSSSAADMVSGFMDNFAANMGALKEVITAGSQQQPQQGQAPQQQQQQKAQDENVLPDSFIEIIQQLDSAEGAEDLINLVLEGVKAFSNSSSARYKMIASSFLGHISKGDKAKTLGMLKMMLDEISSREMASEETAKATYEAFDEYFEAIHDSVSGKAAKRKKMPPAPAAAQSVAPAPANAQASAPAADSAQLESATPDTESAQPDAASEIAELKAKLQAAEDKLKATEVNEKPKAKAKPKPKAKTKSASKLPETVGAKG